MPCALSVGRKLREVAYFSRIIKIAGTPSAQSGVCCIVTDIFAVMPATLTLHGFTGFDVDVKIACLTNERHFGGDENEFQIITQ